VIGAVRRPIVEFPMVSGSVGLAMRTSVCSTWEDECERVAEVGSNPMRLTAATQWQRPAHELSRSEPTWRVLRKW
jgi:hypothetical protein